ncbi:MAG: hypothetical protein H0U85_01840 [Gemmatimonadales bacterium]|nr:hypothetical protein [Gemmatimonadales bacterium]
MTAEAVLVRGRNDIRRYSALAAAAGEARQGSDGRAEVRTGLNAAVAGDLTGWTADDVYRMPKTASVVFLDGGRAYWDHSANKVHYKRVGDRDFYLGRFVGDSASGDTECLVNLNVNPPDDLDLARDPIASTTVGTAAAGAFGYPVRLGGATIFELTATNEAQKCDALSVDHFAKGANAIIEGAFRVLSDGAGTVVDVSIGIANGTHASDADTIAESVFLHLDANITTINAESDDGTTEVVATDTTKTYTEGATLAVRREFWIDMRDPADVQIYIEGVLVLTATVFNVDASAGPWFLLVHLEKSISTDTYKLAVDWLRARYMEQ